MILGEGARRPVSSEGEKENKSYRANFFSLLTAHCLLLTPVALPSTHLSANLLYFNIFFALFL